MGNRDRGGSRHDGKGQSQGKAAGSAVVCNGRRQPRDTTARERRWK